jgi:dihydrofolate reductase
MKQIIVQEMVSVDGFFAGPEGEIDWHVVDGEFNDYAAGVLSSVDTLIFGRVTYDLMAGYWPTPDALKNDHAIAEKMNSLPKIVFSAGKEPAGWNNTKIFYEINPEEISKLKQGPGKDMIIYGSGTIVEAFTRFGLIDEYRFIVNPVVLGRGKSLFPNLEERQKLKFIRSKEFSSGNVLLSYGK